MAELEPVEVLGADFHGVDDQFVAVVVDQGYEFQETASGIDADQEPAARIVFVVEGARIEDVGCRVTHSVVVEPVAAVVLAGGSVQVRH